MNFLTSNVYMKKNHRMPWKNIIYTKIMNIDRIHEFVEKACRLEGKEREESEYFVNELFIAFGHPNFHETGGKREHPYNNKTRPDFIWHPSNKPGVIIEMKSKGDDLKKYYDQIFGYWLSTYPRPQFLVICDFDKFLVYDTNRDLKKREPARIIKLKDLPFQYEFLGFLFPDVDVFDLKPDSEKITAKMCKELGALYLKMVEKDNSNKEQIQIFLLQCIICMFAQDFELLPQGFFTNLLTDAIKAPSTAMHLLNSLFHQMNSDKPSLNKQFNRIAYFNGGLFENIQIPDLDIDTLKLLLSASHKNWTEINPTIFGSLYESTYNNEDRHRFGLHFTYEVDIMKIVRPSIIEPWQNRINTANTFNKLLAIRKELATYKAFDPACGCGNFLYIAFVELRKLELQILKRMATEFKSSFPSSKISGRPVIKIKNMFGFDIQKTSCEIAKLVLTLGKEIMDREWNQEISNLGLEDECPLLPLSNLNENIICCNSLKKERKWPECNVIIGNPPFQGGRNIREVFGNDYADQLRKDYPEITGQPDHCVYWFQLAHRTGVSHIGLIGTNSIAQNQSREVSLKYILDNGGIITNAIKTQKWPGEAKVYVSIVNWVTNKKYIPDKLFLDGHEVFKINSSLESIKDFSIAKIILENLNLSFQACELSGQGFIVSTEQAAEWIKSNNKNQKVLKEMLDGRTLINPNLEKNIVIDFENMTYDEAEEYEEIFEYVRKHVKPEREQNKEKKRINKWWQFGRHRPIMRRALQGLKWYCCLPKVAKHTYFQKIQVEILPCEANMVVASDDYFTLGVLNSRLHRDWVDVQKSTLKSDTRYTNTTCFETFPFPETTEDKKNIVRKIMQKLEDFRQSKMLKKEISITELYNKDIDEPDSILHRYHSELDQAVCECFGFKYEKGKNYNNELLELNLKGNQSGFDIEFASMISNITNTSSVISP